MVDQIPPERGQTRMLVKWAQTDKKIVWNIQQSGKVALLRRCPRNGWKWYDSATLSLETQWEPACSSIARHCYWSERAAFCLFFFVIRVFFLLLIHIPIVRLFFWPWGLNGIEEATSWWGSREAGWSKGCCLMMGRRWRVRWELLLS